jgi:hypothetical protein
LNLRKNKATNDFMKQHKIVNRKEKRRVFKHNENRGYTQKVISVLTARE